MKYLKEVPLLLLISYLALCFFRVPLISDSIIILALSALSAYKFFLEYNPKPSVTQQLEEHDKYFKDELAKYNTAHLTDVHKLKEEIAEFTRSFLAFKGLNADERKKEIVSKKILF